MFKFSCVLPLAVAIVSIYGVNCAAPENAAGAEALVKIVQNCLKECNIKEDDIKQSSPENANPCFKKCFINNVGFINEKGEWNRDEVKERITGYTEIESRLDEFLDDMEKCLQGKEKIGTLDEKINAIYGCYHVI